MAERIAWIDSEMPLSDPLDDLANALDGFNLNSSLIVIRLPSRPNFSTNY